jgi:nucleoid-associated protein YgaU
VGAPGPAGLDQALTLLASAVAVLLCTWLGLSTLAAVLTHLPGRAGRLADHVARVWAPPVVRRLAAVLVGATVTGALAPGTALGEAPPPVPAATAPSRAPSAALATAGPPALRAPGFTPTDPGSASELTDTALPFPGFAATGQGRVSARDTGLPPPGSTISDEAPGWVPTRPLQRPQPSAALVVAGPAGHAVAEVVVHRGDTLWGIVARHLGPPATDAEVAHAWPRWYAANRQVIGDDPDLVKPGQVLHAPPVTYHWEPAR